MLDWFAVGVASSSLKGFDLRVRRRRSGAVHQAVALGSRALGARELAPIPLLPRRSLGITTCVYQVLCSNPRDTARKSIGLPQRCLRVSVHTASPAAHLGQNRRLAGDSRRLRFVVPQHSYMLIAATRRVDPLDCVEYRSSGLKVSAGERPHCVACCTPWAKPTPGRRLPTSASQINSMVCRFYSCF
jgi:hypothetical protein